MAIPPSAKTYTKVVDPTDIEVWTPTISQGDKDTDLLAIGETVTSFTLAATAEAALAGLRILDEADRPAPVLVGLELRYWTGIDAAQWNAAAFSAGEVSLGLELTVNTSLARRKQITLVHKVTQR